MLENVKGLEQTTDEVSLADTDWILQDQCRPSIALGSLAVPARINVDSRKLLFGVRFVKKQKQVGGVIL